MAAAAGAKVFILDKYFYELQRYWDGEKKTETLARLHEETANLATSPHSENTVYGTPTPSAGIDGRKEESPSSQVEDLVHLKGPLTEEAIVSALQTRFGNREFLTNVGPVLLCMNPYTRVGNPLTLTSTHMEAAKHPQLKVVVQEAVKQKEETGSSQAIILSGQSGSGKTFTSMLLLRHLFDVAGGGPETDSFKHLSAALTVLRSLETAKTASNSESSRIGHFMEVQVSNGALYRTKIRSYFLDQTRIVKPLPNEKNYHIFYQILAGLTKEERMNLNLDGYDVHNLKYLSCGDTSLNPVEDALRFEAWKSCLSVLGIPFMDVARIFAAILLLGNVPLTTTAASTSKSCDPGVSACEIKSTNTSSVLKAVAQVLGVSSVALYKGLTSRSHQVNGQLIVRSGNQTNMTACATRDALAKALYCRTVATIVRRANSLKRMGPISGTLSSDSNESVQNHIETSSHHASTVGSGGAKSDKSMKMLTHAIRHANDGFIGILDMFGFEDCHPSRLEQLCINLTSETMQHFYNTHIFKSSIESCKEENIKSDMVIDYFDNVPCIDFISSLRTGLLSMLDTESFHNGSAQSYVSKIRSQHESNPRYFSVTEELHEKYTNLSRAHRSEKSLDKSFGIRHFAGDVVYDASDFLSTNRDAIPDDIVIVFHKNYCTFGFATHLFGMEFKTHFSQDLNPKGINFRISPTHTDFTAGSLEPSSTLTQDFHTRLDNLLRILVHARPHFLRCIRTNNTELANVFDRQTVVQQLRSLQVLETVHLMAGGFSHRMKWRAFKTRYHCLAPSSRLLKEDENVIDYCELILKSFTAALRASRKSRPPVQLLPAQSSASTEWVLGNRHIFLSEGARQQLELMRCHRRNAAALLIQSVWRGVCCRRRWPALKRNLCTIRSLKLRADLSHPHSAQAAGCRPRPQPIAGTPPPESCDPNVVEKTCSLFGLDLEKPPPVPPSRAYTVAGNAKLGYPQTRIMKMNFPAVHQSSDENSGDGGKTRLLKGDAVLVVGASTKRGHLLVEYKNAQFHVPYQYMEFPGPGRSRTNCSSASTKSASSRKDVYCLPSAVSR